MKVWKLEGRKNGKGRIIMLTAEQIKDTVRALVGSPACKVHWGLRARLRLLRCDQLRTLCRVMNCRVNEIWKVLRVYKKENRI